MRSSLAPDGRTATCWSARSHVLLAVGRRPNTDDLGLENAGITTDKHGYIKVDNSLATNVPGIWALGDCNGRGAFTHTAYNDFEIVVANLLDGERRLVTDRQPAYGLYIDPPLGRAGMTEREALASGKSLFIGSRPMTRVNCAVEKGETQCHSKVVPVRRVKVEKKNGKIDSIQIILSFAMPYLTPTHKEALCALADKVCRYTFFMLWKCYSGFDTNFFTF